MIQRKDIANAPSVALDDKAFRSRRQPE